MRRRLHLGDAAFATVADEVHLGGESDVCVCPAGLNRGGFVRAAANESGRDLVWSLTCVLGSAASETQWYCMRGDLPTSPSTTTATWLRLAAWAAPILITAATDRCVVDFIAVYPLRTPHANSPARLSPRIRLLT